MCGQSSSNTWLFTMYSDTERYISLSQVHPYNTVTVFFLVDIKIIQMSLLDKSEEPIARARDVCFSFGQRTIFDGLNLTIPRGKLTVIMGPSGCGKSTFLGLLGGRLVPDSGELVFDGDVVPRKKGEQLYLMRKKMGMLFSKQRAID